MKRKRQDGSVTIEATIGLTAMIFVIISILSFINICRTQMVISLAVDSTAKEMSQYAYFYGISGLQKLADTLKDDAATGETATNQLIGHSVDFMNGMKGMAEAGKDAADAVTNPVDFSSIDGAVDDVNKIVETIKEAGGDVKAHYAETTKAATDFYDQIKDMDMMAYLKSMGAFAAKEGYHAILSKVICPALAKQLCKKHLEGYAPFEPEEGVDTVDQALKVLGIEEGMKGLNFMMSEMFSEDYPNQIHLVCYYSMELSTLIDIPGEARMVFCKEAITNAWLNGSFKEE